MPLLTREIEVYPDDLFARENLGDETDASWWAIYTLSRREKDLMRRLVRLEVPFYCPIIPRRQRSPGGRIRTSYLPLFANYVFLYGDNEQRYEAMTTNCVARYTRVIDGVGLTHDLRQIYELILAGVPLTPESRLEAGDQVRVRSGPFRGYEGYVIRRQGQRRLLVAVDFLQQGASFTLEDCELEPA
ncbi:MAG TPA: antitermination protein NusG [Candidatus Anammoximicrobium sp.]|nr:antitermination protein NusG [Candidatus Anammoximicrobium sp.]